MLPQPFGNHIPAEIVMRLLNLDNLNRAVVLATQKAQIWCKECSGVDHLCRLVGCTLCQVRVRRNLTLSKPVARCRSAPRSPRASSRCPSIEIVRRSLCPLGSAFFRRGHPPRHQRATTTSHRMLQYRKHARTRLCAPRRLLVAESAKRRRPRRQRPRPARRRFPDIRTTCRDQPCMSPSVQPASPGMRQLSWYFHL